MTPWRRLFERRRRQNDLHDEIRAHLAMDTQQRVAAGQDPRSAERAAIKELGNVTLTRERTQRTWRGEPCSKWYATSGTTCATRCALFVEHRASRWW
jgi:hypothetical protein